MKPIIACSLLAGCMFFSFDVNAQAPVFVKVWEKMCGSQAPELQDFNQFMQTDETGNIYIGASTSSGVPSGTKYDPSCYVYDTVATSDMWIFKLDSNGNQIWDRAIGGLEGEVFRSLVKDESGNFILLGASNSNPSCEKTLAAYNQKPDGWVVKINTDSTVIWDKRLGSKEKELFTCGAVAPDGSIIATGYTESSYPNHDISDSTNGWDDIMVFKLDSNGNKIWNYQYGSLGWEFVSDVIALNNEQYLIVGNTNGLNNGDVSSNSPSFDSTGQIRDDNWIIKIDSAGNKIWDRRYGCFLADDYTSSALLDINGDVVVGGVLSMINIWPLPIQPCNDGVADTVARGKRDAWIYKIDTASGNIKNEKRFGGDGDDLICQIVEMQDKGYLLACRSDSHAGFEKSENPVANTNNNPDFWIVRMDSVFNIIWDKTIGGDNLEGCPNIIAINDSTFIIAGQTENGSNGNIGVATIDTAQAIGDIWVAKWYIANPLQVQELSLASFNLYPNPAQDVVYVTLQNAKKTDYNFTVQNMTGETIVNQKVMYNNNQTIVVPTATWPPGVYVINIEGVTRKLVKL